MKRKISETYKMQKKWWLGFLVFLAFPNMINHIRGLSYEPFAYLGFITILYFIPEKRDLPLKISTKEIEFYRNNRDEIEKITHPEKVRFRYLASVFLMGLVFVIISKLTYPIFSKDVLTDTLFEIGVALWGGSITVYILQVLSVREEEESAQKKEAILHILEENHKN
jgi:preprotein translocase subunit SecE